KLNPLGIINTIILIIGGCIYTYVAIVCNVSIDYFIDLFKVYLINTIIFLTITSIIGLVIGQYIPKLIGEIPGYIILLFSFLFLSNFYKEGNGILPLYHIDTFPSTFDMFSFNNIYILYIIFWVVVFTLGLNLLYESGEVNSWMKGKKIIAIIIMVLICSGIAIVALKNSPTFYNVVANEKDEKINTRDLDNSTYYAEKESGYSISEYNMNVKMSDTLENKCEMIFNIEESDVREVEFGLFKELKIDNIKVESKDVDYEREGNVVKVKLIDKTEKNSILKIEVAYKGKVNTVWQQSHKMFSVKKESIFLADVFEWYPKLNDGKIKKYNVKVDYNSNNNIYSNLNEVSEKNFSGEDQEVFFVSGNLKEVDYKGYKIVANEEYLKTNYQLDNTIKSFEVIKKQRNIPDNEVNKIIYAPNLPGKIFTNYKSAYLNTGNDMETFISNK
ncbi:MAG: hypothetical protein ACRDA5_05760, partial [Clostridium sp.]